MVCVQLQRNHRYAKSDRMKVFMLGITETKTFFQRQRRGSRTFDYVH